MLDSINEHILGQNINFIKSDIKRQNIIVYKDPRFNKMTWQYITILALTAPCFSRRPPSYEDIYPADITGKKQNQRCRSK